MRGVGSSVSLWFFVYDHFYRLRFFLNIYRIVFLLVFVLNGKQSKVVCYGPRSFSSHLDDI